MEVPERRLRAKHVRRIFVRRFGVLASSDGGKNCQTKGLICYCLICRGSWSWPQEVGCHCCGQMSDAFKSGFGSDELLQTLHRGYLYSMPERFLR